MVYTKINTENILKWLNENLSEERFHHSLGAMDSAAILAEKFGKNVEKCKIAALLHDCAKCVPNDDLKELLLNKCSSYEECELINPKTWHAPVSAYYAKEIFGVEDNEILSAIRWHTLGKTDMSNFEMIIFLADKIEHNTREPEYREPIEKAIYKHNCLEKGMLKSFKLTIKSLMKRKLTICMQTVDVYNELIKKLY
ncbi:MAG: bis(5'-nucleosyl)-tetraphosphatase (symmetrical) YqeK [Candidatus Gastranaerophilales bacterium]|nr:bis(5'-nucleosyl)-tetraphosphatase (symmetrical) YqeK [Candidatus Gastranaerophilales bacterium]